MARFRDLTCSLEEGNQREGARRGKWRAAVEGMIDIDTLYGPISVPDWPGDLIVRALRAFGEWAPVEQRLFASLIRKHDHVWDGGAFLGTFGLGAVQKAAELGQMPDFLLAIEPGRAIATHLGSNLERNSPCSWNVAPYALSLDEKMLFPDGDSSGNHGAVSYSPMSDAPGEQHEQTLEAQIASRTNNPSAGVEGLPLWRLREKYGDYDCLKLDVEGMEFDALRSDFSYLKSRKPAIWVECNENPASLKILEALNALEYDPYYIAFPAFREENFNGNPEKFFPMAYEASLVGASPDRLEAFLAEIDDDGIIAVPVQDSWELRKAMWATPRWAEEDWTKCSRPELIALLGRKKRNEELGSFLNQ